MQNWIALLYTWNKQYCKSSNLKQKGSQAPSSQWFFEFHLQRQRLVFWSHRRHSGISSFVWLSSPHGLCTSPQPFPAGSSGNPESASASAWRTGPFAPCEWPLAQVITCFQRGLKWGVREGALQMQTLLPFICTFFFYLPLHSLPLASPLHLPWPSCPTDQASRRLTSSRSCLKPQVLWGWHSLCVTASEEQTGCACSRKMDPPWLPAPHRAVGNGVVRIPSWLRKAPDGPVQQWRGYSSGCRTLFPACLMEMRPGTTEKLQD